METKLERITDKSSHETRPKYTCLYHLLSEELLTQCHKELDGRKAVGVDGVTKEEYSQNLKENIRNLVERLKNKAYKPAPSLRVYIPKGNGKMRPLGITAYEDKIVQLGLKKIIEAVYEPKFCGNMYGFRPGKNCHMAVKEMIGQITRKRINYIVDADVKGFFRPYEPRVGVKVRGILHTRPQHTEAGREVFKSRGVGVGGIPCSRRGFKPGKYHQSAAGKYLYAPRTDPVVS